MYNLKHFSMAMVIHNPIRDYLTWCFELLIYSVEWVKSQLLSVKRLVRLACCDMMRLIFLDFEVSFLLISQLVTLKSWNFG